MRKISPKDKDKSGDHKKEKKAMSKRTAWMIILICSLIVILINVLKLFGIRP